MQKNSKAKFLKATKGKVIVGFVLACVALAAAWYISSVAFKKMLGTVKEISAPNHKLRIVNGLSNSISRLDQLQRNQTIRGKGRNAEFIQVSKGLRKSLDTLATLYKSDTVQLGRIKSIKKLLADRDRHFLMYLKVRERLVNTKSFSAEVTKLGKLINQRSDEADSAVIAQMSTAATALTPQKEQKSRGFFSRLFGKKKSEVDEVIAKEYKVKSDTASLLAKNRVVNKIEKTLKTIESEQKAKSWRFLQREASLANASAQITRQMLNVLHEVEAEAVIQLDANNAKAQLVVSKGISQITILLVVAFLLTIVLLYFILTDITKSHHYRLELELAKDEAEYHSKAKQRFLSNMSHEIRTPLQSILGYAELINKQERPLKKDINAIYQSSVHLLQIVNEVLDYNRITSGEFTFHHQPFALQSCLDEVVAAMRPLAEKKSVELQTTFDLNGASVVNGDVFRLKQILFNLLGNAIKFTNKGHVMLLVSAKLKAGFAHLNFTVQDTGIGFDEDEALRIFNEFEQIETREKYAYNQTGAGLGLAIVKSLVEGQGGRINARSRKGHGATFAFHLRYPIAQANMPAQRMRLAYKNSQIGQVWVVDDDKLILELCSLILAGANISHQTFNNATAVLAAPVPPDISHILLDMRLPEMSGIKLYRLLKNTMPKEVKFYAITAQVLPDEQASILNEGFTGMMMKPFRSDDLLSLFEVTEKLVDTKKQSDDFDLGNVEKMTMGDRQLMQKIIAQFIVDCHEDIGGLQAALLANNQNECQLIVHRLAGRLGQMGAGKLAKGLREAEQQVAISLTENVKQQIIGLMAGIEGVVEAIKGYSIS